MFFSNFTQSRPGFLFYLDTQDALEVDFLIPQNKFTILSAAMDSQGKTETYKLNANTYIFLSVTSLQESEWASVV